MLQLWTKRVPNAMYDKWQFFFPLLVEILKMRQLGQQNTQRVVEENRKLRSDIQDMVDALDARNKQIKESEHDKKNLEQEKLKVDNCFHLRQNVLSTIIM